MSLAYTHNVLEKYSKSYLLLDTCTIIDASNCDEIDFLLRKIAESGCTFLSLPAVKEEFTCSAKNKTEFKNLLDYIDSLNILFLNNTEKRITNNDNIDFSIVLGRCKNIHPSYVDRMLLSIPHLYQKSSENIHLMTSNYKDVPLELYNLEDFITYSDKIFHNIGIYSFNANSYERRIKTIE